jgi:uncharacterized membrane protein YphA (DoxX/SURF4 family)
MRHWSLFLLRVTMGALMLVWGIDKLVNVRHGLAVSERFYLGLFNAPDLVQAFGVVQLILGALVVVGLWRRVAYPVLIVVSLTTLLGVWRSIIDPWGWYQEGTNALFFPSVIIAAAGFVMMAWRDEDRLALDARRVAG